MAQYFYMSNIHDRWDGSPSMNCKEQTARNRVAGCGGFDNPFSPTYQNPLNSPYSFESLKIRNRVAFTLKHSPEFNQKAPIWSQSEILAMRSKLQRELDSLKATSSASKRAAATQSSPTLFEAFNIMNDVIDYVVLKAELAATSLKLNPIKILGRVGMVTGGLGVVLSIREAMEDPTLENILIAALEGGFFVIVILAGATILAPIWATIATCGAVVLLTWKVGKAVYIAIKKNK